MSDEVKELAIGEIGEIDGVKVECVEADMHVCCELCVFSDKTLQECGDYKCTPSIRTDGKWAYFREVKE